MTATDIARHRRAMKINKIGEWVCGVLGTALFCLVTVFWLMGVWQ